MWNNRGSSEETDRWLVRYFGSPLSVRGWSRESSLYVVGKPTKTQYTWYVIFPFFILVLSLYIVILLCALIHYYRKSVGVYKSNIKEYEERMSKIDKDKVGQMTTSNWENILLDIQSPLEADWKSAILRADAIVESVLRDKGFEGATMGDILTNASKETLASLGTHGRLTRCVMK